MSSLGNLFDQLGDSGVMSIHVDLIVVSDGDSLYLWNETRSGQSARDLNQKAYPPGLRECSSHDVTIVWRQSAAAKRH